MTISDTPLTDALDLEVDGSRDLLAVAKRFRTHARRLERDRADLIAALESLRGIVAQTDVWNGTEWASYDVLVNGWLAAVRNAVAALARVRS